MDISKLFSCPLNNLASPILLTPQPTSSTVAANEFRAAVADGSFLAAESSVADTPFQRLISATPYIQSVAQSEHLKIITMTIGDWEKGSVSRHEDIARLLREISDHLFPTNTGEDKGIDYIQNVSGIGASWVDSEHTILNLGATLDATGVLTSNPDVSAISGTAGVVDFAMKLHTLLGYLSGMVMTALTSPSYIDFCRRRKQAFNTPMPGPDIESNAFHNSYDLCTDASRRMVFETKWPLHQCPLSYSMHLHVARTPPSPDQVLIFDDLLVYTPLGHLQLTIFHAIEPASCAVSMMPAQPSPRQHAVDVFARASDLVVNGHQTGSYPGPDAEDGSISPEHGLLSGQQAVLGGRSNYDGFVLVEKLREFQAVVSRLRTLVDLDLGLQIEQLGEAVRAPYNTAVREQTKPFLDGHSASGQLSREISLVKHEAASALSVQSSLPPPDQPSLGLAQRPRRIQGPTYIPGSPQPSADDVPEPSPGRHDDIESTPADDGAPSPPAEVRKRKRDDGSKGPKISISRSLTVQEKLDRTTKIVDGIVASFERECSPESLEFSLTQARALETVETVDVRINAWRSVDGKMKEIPSGADLAEPNPSKVGEHFVKLRDALVRPIDSGEELELRKLVWQATATVLVLESINKLDQPDAHFVDPSSPGPSSLTDKTTTAKIVRTIDHFVANLPSDKHRLDEKICFELDPSQLLDDSGGEPSVTLRFSGHVGDIGAGVATQRSNKAKLLKQILFHLFLRAPMSRLSTSVVNRVIGAQDDPHRTASKPASKPGPGRAPRRTVVASDRIFNPKPDCKMALEISRWKLLLEICKTVRLGSSEQPNIEAYFMLQPLFSVCFRELYRTAFTHDVISGVCDRLLQPAFQQHRDALSELAYRYTQRVKCGLFHDATSSLCEPGLFRLSTKPPAFQPLLVRLPDHIPCFSRFAPGHNIVQSAIVQSHFGSIEQLLFPALFACFCYGVYLHELSERGDVPTDLNLPEQTPEQVLTRRALADPENWDHVQPFRCYSHAFRRFSRNGLVGALKQSGDDYSPGRLLRAICIWRICAPSDDILLSRLLAADDASAAAECFQLSLGNEDGGGGLDFLIPGDPDFSMSINQLLYLFEALDSLVPAFDALREYGDISFGLAVDCLGQYIPQLSQTMTCIAVCLDAHEFRLIQPPTALDVVESLFDASKNRLLPRSSDGLHLLLFDPRTEFQADIIKRLGPIDLQMVEHALDRILYSLNTLVSAAVPHKLDMWSIVAALSSISYQVEYASENSTSSHAEPVSAIEE